MRNRTEPMLQEVSETAPIEISLAKLIVTLSEFTEDMDEIFAAIDGLVGTGQVVLNGDSYCDILSTVPLHSPPRLH